MEWKADWDRVRQNHIRWWDGRGLVLYLTAPRDEPVEPVDRPRPPADLFGRWTDPQYRAAAGEYQVATTFFAADAYPHYKTNLGPGSLGTFIGAEPHFVDGTVWYETCIEDPEASGPIRFDPSGNKWLAVHVAVMEAIVGRARGRFLVSMPDLIENLDTLAALRGGERLLTDLVERPDWVQTKLAEINEAFFAAFDALAPIVGDGEGGNTFLFDIWGPGRTAKVQCDISCMISPAMFRRFVVPHLSAQCRWLDYSMYHLDGEDALQHLDALLEIESLDAIEWTPRTRIGPGEEHFSGGGPKWYDLYRRIKAGGKSVQAVGVTADQVIPLIEAVGPEGMFICARAPDQATAERLAEEVENLRP